MVSSQPVEFREKRRTTCFLDRAKPWLAVIVKELAPGSKMTPSTVVLAEIDMPVVFEWPNVAVSADPLGTVIGVQLTAVFQSPEAGLRSHVAFPALAIVGKDSNRPKLIPTEVNFFLTVLRIGLVVREVRADKQPSAITLICASTAADT